MTTIARGDVICEDGRLTGEPGHGCFLAREPYDYVRPTGRMLTPFDPVAGR